MQPHGNGLNRFIPILCVCIVSTGVAVLVLTWPRLAPILEVHGIAGLTGHPITIAVLCADAIALATAYRCGILRALAIRDDRSSDTLRICARVACVSASAAAVIVAAISRANGFAIGGVGLLAIFGLFPSLLVTIGASAMLLTVSWKVLASMPPGSGADR